MFKPLSLFLAQRYVRSRHSNGFATFISASSTVGIALGVMVLIVVLSAMNGFEKALAQRLLSIVPHGELIAAERPFDNWSAQAQDLQARYPSTVVAPVIKISAMMQRKDQLKGLEVRGVDLALEQQVSDISDYVIEGSWQQLASNNSIIIGAGIAKKLALKLGDKVQLLVPPSQLQQGRAPRVLASHKFPVPVKHSVEVVGIFKFGGTIDDTLAYINHQQASDLMGYQAGQSQGLRLKLADVFQAPRLVRDIADSVNHYVYIYDWTNSQGGLFNDIQLVRVVMFIVLIIVIAVASFNIVSTLIMVVNEKKGDIAILRTMGANSASIMLTFIGQGLVNGILGCTVGGLLGVTIANNLTAIFSSLEDLLSVKFMSADVYFIDFLPSVLVVQDVYVTITCALCLSFLATLYPAWQATKVQPAQVLGQI